MKLKHLSLALLALTATQGAHAATANAVIDWSTLQVQLWPTTAPLVFDMSIGQNSFVYAESQSPGLGEYVPSAFPSVPDWTTPISEVATTTHAQGSGMADALALTASSSAQQSIAALWGDYNFGAGSASREAFFSLSGAGTAVMTVDWSISVTDANPGDTLEWGDAGVVFSGDYVTSDGLTFDNVYLDNWISSYGGTGGAQSGTFQFAVVNPTALTTADGMFFAEATSWSYGYVNPVPEPETWAMMLTGLGLVGLWGRRRGA